VHDKSENESGGETHERSDQARKSPPNHTGKADVPDLDYEVSPPDASEDVVDIGDKNDERFVIVQL